MNILLVVYDNDSYISWFPQGIAYLAAALRQAGYSVTIYNQDIFHWPEEHLTAYLDAHRFDVVGVGVIGGYYQYRKLLAISAAINQSRNRPFYVIGGHGPSPEPEYFLKKTNADAVVIGEGDVTVVELVDALAATRPLDTIHGLAYLDAAGTLVRTPPRALIKDVNTIALPAWDLFPMDHYTLLRCGPSIKNSQRALPLLTARGCIFKCNFCYRMDKGFRPRSPESILEEMDILRRTYHVTHFEFSDELLMSSERRMVEISEAILNYGHDVTWSCNGRLNFATTEALRIAKRAGCLFINYGIESLDQATLDRMNKKLTVDQVYKGIEETLRHGISPGLNIIFGNIDEPLSALEEGVAFILKYHDQSYLRTIRPVTPYPGSDLYYYAIEKGLLRDVSEFYEVKHTNSDLIAVNFTQHSEEEIYEALYKANMKLAKAYYDTIIHNIDAVSRKLYFEMDTSFRGFRH